MSFDERVPGLVVAVAAAMGAVYSPNMWLKGLLAGIAATAGAAVVVSLNGMNSAMNSRKTSQPHWRTLKTYRVVA